MASDGNTKQTPHGESSSAPGVAPSGMGVPPSGAGAPQSAFGPNESLLNPIPIAGRKLGQYTILEKIGQGGMGSVFKAFDTALERTVALKVLFSNPLDDPKQAQRFIREARSLARLNHPNLLHVYNVGAQDDCYYFAMELLEGDTLSGEIRRRKRVDPRDLIDWAGQVLSALHYVHRQGITHRDIKSGNVMICGRRAVLMDFGLAKDEQFSGLTSVGVVLGTPDYISPEAAEGLSSGPPTDIYSLGVVMYEALTGALPFVGRSAMSIIRQHLEIPPPPIEGTLPDIDPLLAGIIHKCLAKKAADRYADCTLLAKELLRVYSTPELEHLAQEAPLGSAVNAPRSKSQSVAPRPASSGDATIGNTSAKSPPLGSLDATIVDPNRSKSQRPSSMEATMTIPAHVAANVNPDDPTVLQSVVQPPSKSHSPFFWGVVGFFGMLLLVVIFAAMQKHKRDKENVREWKGQAVIRNAPGVSGEKVRWLRFDADDPDPSKWYHEIQRQQADGTWKTERIPHGEYMGRGGGTFEIVPEEAESK